MPSHVHQAKSPQRERECVPANVGTPPSRRVHLFDVSTHSVSEDAFDRLAAKFLEHYLGCRPRTFQSLWVSLESARGYLAASGITSEPQMRRHQEALARDLTRLAALMVRGSTQDRESLKRAGAKASGALCSLIRVLELSGDAVYRVSSDSRSAAVRRAGEVTCAGSLVCNGCGHVSVSRGSHIVEPCGGCGASTFLKTF